MRDLVSGDARLAATRSMYASETLPGRVPPLPAGASVDSDSALISAASSLTLRYPSSGARRFEQHVGLGEALGYALSPRLEVGDERRESVESAADSERPAAMKASTRNGR